MPPALYDQIGATYTATRRPDPRIAAAIMRALGRATTVVNVGSGAGAYEPTDRPVVAVEPSSHMIRQRPTGITSVIQASAEALPFRDDCFDAGSRCSRCITGRIGAAASTSSDGWRLAW